MKIDISKGLIHAARNSHALYEEALKKKKEESDGQARKKAQKRKNTEKLKELEKKKKKNLDNART